MLLQLAVSRFYGCGETDYHPRVVAATSARRGPDNDDEAIAGKLPGSGPNGPDKGMADLRPEAVPPTGRTFLLAALRSLAEAFGKDGTPAKILELFWKESEACARARSWPATTWISTDASAHSRHARRSAG